MGRSNAQQVYDRLDDHYDDDLRSVGYYDDGESEFVFIRDDVESTYDSRDHDQILRDVRLEALDSSNQESLYAHGELLCTVRCFDNATELHTNVDETTGVVAAVDTGAIADLREATTICQEALTTEFD